ncbi:UNVERIFIED_CONTAM: hypothetical protein FKN15_022356 [Acipenser sinensis]
MMWRMKLLSSLQYALLAKRLMSAPSAPKLSLWALLQFCSWFWSKRSDTEAESWRRHIAQRSKLFNVPAGVGESDVDLFPSTCLRFCLGGCPFPALSSESF